MFTETLNHSQKNGEIFPLLRLLLNKENSICCLSCFLFFCRFFLFSVHLWINESVPYCFNFGNHTQNNLELHQALIDQLIRKHVTHTVYRNTVVARYEH